jgi:hypothetical protein
MNFCVEKHVLNVDIADARYVLLVKQEGFDVAPFLVEQLFKIIQRELFVQRVYA